MTLTERAASRIIYQYRNSPKFKQWISVLPQILESHFVAQLEAMANILSIDDQSDEMLDIVGRIVGVERPFVDSSILGFFGWEGNPLRLQWGAPWLPRNISETVLMPDAYYRILIKAKVAKNTSDATIDDIIKAVQIISGANVSALVDNQDMTFNIIFGEPLSIPVRIMLTEFDIVPRPQGVKFAGFTEPTESGYFGYIGDPLVTPYGVAPYAGTF